jgi:hypothetical protein
MARGGTFDRSGAREASYEAVMGHDGIGWVPIEAGTYRTDAFGRARVSEPQTIFQSKGTLDIQPLVYDDQQISGTATSTYSAAKSSVALAVLDTAAGRRVRQSRTRAPYQPGKSQLALITFTGPAGGPEAGLDWAVGLYDDADGVFLQQDGTAEPQWVRRSSASGSAVDTPVAQSAWSEDTLSELDLTKAQIAVIDFEWLGVGIVRVGFVIDGVYRYVHTFKHANAATGVYMTTPNLPVRYEIGNDGTAGAAELEAICSSISSEGGVEDLGLTRSASRSVVLTTLDDADLYPLVTIRLRAGYLDAFVVPDALQVLCTSTSTYRWALLLNPTVAGAAESFTAVTNSPVEAAVGATNATKVSGGTIIAEGFAVDTQTSKGTIEANVGSVQLGSAISGTADRLTLAVQRLVGTTESFYGQLGWKESA